MLIENDVYCVSSLNIRYDEEAMSIVWAMSDEHQNLITKSVNKIIVR